MKKIIVAIAIGVGIAMGMSAPVEADARPRDNNDCCVRCGSTTACGYCGASCGAASCTTGNPGC
jgi:hypothetical protein